MSPFKQEDADEVVHRIIVAARERCAKVAQEIDGRVIGANLSDVDEAYNSGYMDACKEIAAKIREGQ